jgi:hypothetical protein
MQMVYLKSRFNKVPQDRLDMMTRWIDDAVDQEKQMIEANPPQQPQGAPQNGMASHVQADVQRMTAHHAAQNLTGT